MYAYNITYVNDAASSLGELFDYMVNCLNMDVDIVFRMFATSSVGHHFECGNPSYIAGHTGVELAYLLVHEVNGIWADEAYDWPIDKTPQYWAGWAIAQYQWVRNLRFEEMIRNSLSASRVVDMYVLHEADITKFYDACDTVIFTERSQKGSMLRRLRKYHEFTQKELSEKSGVSLRMIQLYEQGQNDITRAQVNVLHSLSEALNCEIEDLI